MLGYYHVMWQLTVMTRGNGKIYFQFSPLLNFLFNLVPQFFKMIQFCPFKFETKLVNKFNYNLYIHIKIIVLNLYIKSLHLNIQIILFLTSVKISSVKNYKGENVKNKII